MKTFGEWLSFGSRASSSAGSDEKVLRAFPGESLDQAMKRADSESKNFRKVVLKFNNMSIVFLDGELIGDENRR